MNSPIYDQGTDLALLLAEIGFNPIAVGRDPNNLLPIREMEVHSLTMGNIPWSANPIMYGEFFPDTVVIGTTSTAGKLVRLYGFRDNFGDLVAEIGRVTL